MNRKILQLTSLLLTLALVLCACGGGKTPHTGGSGPGRMIRRIEVSAQPEDEEFNRTYVTQESMNGLLSLLRSMESDEAPVTEPNPNGSQSYYTATVTFANGQQSIYYLLGQTYLRLGDNPWCVIDSDQFLSFRTYIREHPSDDGSAPTEITAAPTETTAPPETAALTE